MPEVPGLRPTPDRVRETVFNWLMPVIPGSRCLDLFAGTGVLGLEAASRGAADVVLVERDLQAAAALRANIDRLAADQVRLEVVDALDYLRRVPQSRFDIVFVDPPYALDLAGTAIAALLAGGWLAPEGFIYTEWPRERAPPSSDPPWRLARAGTIQYALYRFGGASG